MHPQRRDPVPVVRSAMEAGGDEACGRRHCMAQPVAMLRFDEGAGRRPGSDPSHVLVNVADD